MCNDTTSEESPFWNCNAKQTGCQFPLDHHSLANAKFILPFGSMIPEHFPPQRVPVVQTDEKLILSNVFELIFRKFHTQNPAWGQCNVQLLLSILYTT